MILVGAVLHEKRDNENSEALRIFRGEKREKGSDKDRSGKRGREQDRESENGEKRRRDKDLLGIIMQLFLTFQDLAVHCRILSQAFVFLYLSPHSSSCPSLTTCKVKMESLKERKVYTGCTFVKTK